MKILETPTRISLSSFKRNTFMVLVDYEVYSPGYGKDIKNTIYSFNQLTTAKNFNEYEREIIVQMPIHSWDLLQFRLRKLKTWIIKKF